MSTTTFPVNCGVVPLENKLIILNRKTMQWISVPKGAFSRVEELLSDNLDAESTTQNEQLKEALQSIGLPISSKTSNRDVKSKPKSILVRLQLTDRCNLSCVYCFNETGEERVTMTWDTLQKSIDLFFAHPLKKHGIKFLFYGGEATLEWALFTKAIDYISSCSERTKVKNHVCLITNGTLLTPENAELLMRRRVGVGISYDGHGVNDQTRVTTFGTGTGATIRQSLNLFQGYSLLYVLTTVSRYNDKKMYDIVIDLQEQGVPDVAIRPFVTLDKAHSLKELRLNPAHYINGLRKIVHGIEKQVIWSIRVEEILRILLPLITTDQLYSDANCYRCSAGRTVFYVSSKGELKGCDELPSSLLPPIGTVHGKGFEFAKLNRAIQVNAYADRSCRQCNWLYICKGGCPGHAASENDTFRSRYRLGCAVRKVLYPELLGIISEKESMLKKYFVYHMSTVKKEELFDHM